METNIHVPMKKNNEVLPCLLFGFARSYAHMKYELDLCKLMPVC